MVVLESPGTVMTSNGHQYLQPDYLSPLPTTLDAKKSPLALLAQTCSQIGADTPSSKSLLPTLEKSKRSGDRASTTPPKISSGSSSTGTEGKQQGLAFKPYEANVLTKKSDTPRPSSKPSEYEEKRRTPSRKSASPPKEEKASGTEKPKSPDSGASPIIRSGLEVLQGHPKDLPLGIFKPPLLPPGCCPPGLEVNPAFRPSLGGFSPHHVLAAAAAGYPGPYVGYARVKTASGGEALVPVCKDPYCGGCQLGALTSPCPAGCSQCDHHKYLGLVPPHPFYQLGRPYVCNWISGDNYCGKRFGTSEELLQHLRTHTSDSSALLAPLRYPNPPLSPLSASRYHPYSKPPSAAPIPAPFFAPYYSPYALYGQRSTAVHP